MIALKCKMCGGDLTVDKETSVCECEYCGSKQTIPTVDDEKLMKLYDRANRLRMANEFDKAEGVYETIIEEADEEAEAYWGIVLCKYGIEYVDDPASGEKIPTCHRVSYDSVLEDPDFEMVMENCDALSRAVYREQAKQIEEIRKNIIEVSGKEEPYDIFICYKETTEDGDRTVDSVIAQDTYDALTQNGYRVFFSRITLEDKLGTEYEPYIFAALSSARVMLVFGTSYDNFNAVWVKNEWSRYLKFMAEDKNKRLIPCYKEVDAYDMPKEFKHLQAQDMGKVGALQDLLRGIDKILKKGEDDSDKGKSDQNIQDAVTNAINTNNINSLLERAFMLLEDKEYKKADGLFEKVLNQNPKCAEAYMGKLLVKRECTDVDALAYQRLLGSDYVGYKGKVIWEKPQCDIENIVREKYIKDADINDFILHNSIGQIRFVYVTFMEKLKSEISDEQADTFAHYFEGFKGPVGGYYKHFCQFATDEIKEKYNIDRAYRKLVNTCLDSESKKIAKKRKEWNQNLEKTVDIANQYIKDQVGDEYDQIESEYQERLKEWETAYATDIKNWEIECERRKTNWPEVRKEIQDNWNAECVRLQTEYNQKMVAYTVQKEEIEAYNEGVKKRYVQEKEYYDSEVEVLNQQIANKKQELSGLNGWFTRKRKEELSNQITMLESRLSALNKPEYDSKIKLFPKEPDMPVLPMQPEDSETPLYPPKPQPDRPKRRKFATNINGEDLLIKIFKQQGIIDVEEYRTVFMGRYEDTEDPIEWRILDIQEDKALLISRYALTWEEMDDRDAALERDGDVITGDKYGMVNWETSDFRDWLNHTFYNKVFNDREKSSILKSKIKNEKNAYGGTGADTEDYVFLLSLEEAEKYFDSDEDRLVYGCEDIINMLIPNNMMGDVWMESEVIVPRENLVDPYATTLWALRTTTDDPCFPYTNVVIWGEAGGSCCLVNDFRPAIWVSLNTDDVVDPE